MKQLRQAQLKLLDELNRICVENNLIYWIDFGTLLGAVRHKGFIPWDDDLDVSMPISDYKKFLVIAEKELPNDIFLQTAKTDRGYKQYFTKLRDCYSTFLEHNEVDDGGYHKGIYIDVFPSVFYPRIPKLFKNILTFITSSSRARTFKKNNKNYFYYLIYLFCKIIWWLLKPLKGDKFAQTPEDNGYFFYIADSYLYPLKNIYFEGKMYPAPNKEKEYLTYIFKDYMTPPPVNKRIGHAKLILPNKPCNHPRALNR